MTNDEMRLTVCIAMGWSGCEDANCEWRKCQHLHFGNHVGFPESYSTKRYPDYPNDLNACAEMRKALKWDEQAEFIFHLEAQTSLGNLNFTREWKLVDSSAHDQTMAFLKAKKLWRESPQPMPHPEPLPAPRYAMMKNRGITTNQ